jgi:hypothetical protein
VCLLKREN